MHTSHAMCHDGEMMHEMCFGQKWERRVFQMCGLRSARNLECGCMYYCATTRHATGRMANDCDNAYRKGTELRYAARSEPRGMVNWGRSVVCVGIPCGKKKVSHEDSLMRHE